MLYGTPDLDASMSFLTDVLGFKLSDTSPGIIAFLRCSADHHNVGLINSPVPFFHHSSWQVNDVDEIGKGAHNLLAVDPDRHVWGLGRHFLGSNLFWYFRDPAGNFAEYYADLDQIPDRCRVGGARVGARQVAVRLGSAPSPQTSYRRPTSTRSKQAMELAS